jgi:hypothetical protein
MFIVHTTHPQGASVKISTIASHCPQPEELPQGIEEIGEGVWYLPSVEQLSFLVTLGQLSLNTGLEFHVKGCNHCSHP